MTGDETPKTERPRRAKGPQPHLLDCADAQRVLSFALSGAAEISALYDRIDTLERFVLEEMNVPPERLAAMFERDDAGQERTAWRRDFVDRLLRGFETDLSTDKRTMTEEDYKSLMAKLAQP